MIGTHNTIAQVFFFFGVVAFFTMGFLGLSHFSMNMEMNGTMSTVDCPFMIGSSLCAMTPLQHMAMWQSIFTSMPGQSSALILLLLVSALAYVFVWTRYLYAPPKYLLARSSYHGYQNYIPTEHSFQELYSNGILNPKLF